MVKLDYKDIQTLKKYISRKGRILPREKTGLSAKKQRELAREIKRARFMSLIPFVSRD